MSRQCLPSGQWGAVDFTTCTLRSGVSRPFTMYWSSLVNESSLNDVVRHVFHVCLRTIVSSNTNRALLGTQLLALTSALI